MSEQDEIVCEPPADLDNRAVRKAQAWLNEHLGEQVICCVRWRGMSTAPVFAQGTLELAGAAALEEVQGFGGELSDQALSALDELHGLYMVARTLMIDVGALAVSATHVRIAEAVVWFVIEPGDDPRQEVASIAVALADADEAC